MCYEVCSLREAVHLQDTVHSEVGVVRPNPTAVAVYSVEFHFAVGSQPVGSGIVKDQ